MFCFLSDVRKGQMINHAHSFGAGAAVLNGVPDTVLHSAALARRAAKIECVRASRRL